MDKLGRGRGESCPARGREVCWGADQSCQANTRQPRGAGRGAAIRTGLGVRMLLGQGPFRAHRGWDLKISLETAAEDFIARPGPSSGPGVGARFHSRPLTHTTCPRPTLATRGQPFPPAGALQCPQPEKLNTLSSLTLHMLFITYVCVSLRMHISGGLHKNIILPILLVTIQEKYLKEPCCLSQSI